MIFEFKKIGLIESAKIELKGLTVITGLNDTGKSFISKGIYSIIKTVNEANVQAASEKFEQINSLVNNIFSLHRQYVPFTPQRIQQFNPNDLINNLFASKKTKKKYLILMNQLKQTSG